MAPLQGYSYYFQYCEASTAWPCIQLQEGGGSFLTRQELIEKLLDVCVKGGILYS